MFQGSGNSYCVLDIKCLQCFCRILTAVLKSTHQFLNNSSTNKNISISLNKYFNEHNHISFLSEPQKYMDMEKTDTEKWNSTVHKFTIDKRHLMINIPS